VKDLNSRILQRPAMAQRQNIQEKERLPPLRVFAINGKTPWQRWAWHRAHARGATPN